MSTASATSPKADCSFLPGPSSEASSSASPIPARKQVQTSTAIICQSGFRSTRTLSAHPGSTSNFGEKPASDEGWGHELPDPVGGNHAVELHGLLHLYLTPTAVLWSENDLHVWQLFGILFARERERDAPFRRSDSFYLPALCPALLQPV